MEFILPCLAVVAGVTLLGTIAFKFLASRRRAVAMQVSKPIHPPKERQDQEEQETDTVPAAIPRQKKPDQIIIGQHPDQPIVTIKASRETAAYDAATPLDLGSVSISRLSALIQAVPSVLAPARVAGKNLMEVVIKGDLVKASDGNGLRAIAMGPKGMAEHARLFEVKNFQSMLNAAAIWQLASVIVAQKHLTDINHQLDEIRLSIQDISKFLDNQRKARIQSTYDYLRQVQQAIGSGELPGSVRNELESCERDLLEIQRHLEQEFRQRVDEKVAHSEMVGTAELTRGITSKLDRIDDLSHDMLSCLKTRLTAWHVLALYPGEPQLKQARRRGIEQSLAEAAELCRYLSGAMDEEVSGVKAFWNRQGTLESRKAELSNRSRQTSETLARELDQGRLALERSNSLLLEDDGPIRILLQMDNGVLVGARELACHPAPWGGK